MGWELYFLVGVIMMVLGDKFYVFGGRILLRSRLVFLMVDFYELDLICWYWIKLEMIGDIFLFCYFYLMCVFGDIKMVCYGGMFLMMS